MHQLRRKLLRAMGAAAPLMLAAGTGLLLLSPVFLVISVAIKLTSPGPIFFEHAVSIINTANNR